MSMISKLLASQAAKFSESVSRMDGWVNTLSGLGSALRDKGMAATFVGERPLSESDLDELFHGDDLANRVATALPDDAFREGFIAKRSVEERAGEDATVGDVQDKQTVMANRIKELGVVAKMKEALTWSRAQGVGGVMLLVDGSGELHEPLIPERVTRVVGLTVIERVDLTRERFYEDPLDPKYGTVELYTLNRITADGQVAQTQVRVHETRLVLFGGELTSRKKKAANGGWDHSTLQRVYPQLRKTNTAYDSVLAMMNDLSQAVFKITGLLDAMAEGKEEDLTKRMTLVDLLRSITRAIVLDKDGEDFEVVERSAATGTDALLDKVFLRFSSSARMPVSILFSQSPAGLNATGAIELRWWYDVVRAVQSGTITPKLLVIVCLIAQEQWPGEDVSQWTIEWPSLWQMTPDEQATVRGKVAATDKSYVDMGVALPEEIALSRFGQGGYSMETTIDLEARKAVLESELAEMTDPAPEPTPPPGPPLPGQPPAPAPEPEDPENAPA